MKNLKNLGKTLSKNEQKAINGGRRGACVPGRACSDNQECVNACILTDIFATNNTCRNGYCTGY